MASTYFVRNRIRGIENMSRIVNAMEMIAISKMKQAQREDLNSRPYADKIEHVIGDLASQIEITGRIHPLLQKRAETRMAVVHVTPDRGFSGGLLSNINRLTANFILKQNIPTNVISVGRKGTEYMTRYGQNIQAEFVHLGDQPNLINTLPISYIIMDDYEKAEVDAVYLAYTKFVNTEKQTPVIQQILPVQPSITPHTRNVQFIFEPNAEAVLDRLLHRFVETEVFHAILESIASEQSARAVAMQSATDNAKKLAEKLTLTYHKTRQESITEELIDITAGTPV
jgi:F-type H+-transporting ATPase subunit gamma